MRLIEDKNPTVVLADSPNCDCCWQHLLKEVSEHANLVCVSVDRRVIYEEAHQAAALAPCTHCRCGVVFVVNVHAGLLATRTAVTTCLLQDFHHIADTRGFR